MKMYAATKLALNLLTFETARRFEGAGITCNAVNPGFVNTRPSYASRFDLFIGTVMSPFGKSSEQGAIPSVWAASADELAGVTGQYFNPKCRPVDPSPASLDKALAARLLEIIVELTGTAW